VDDFDLFFLRTQKCKKKYPIICQQFDWCTSSLLQLMWDRSRQVSTFSSAFLRFTLCLVLISHFPSAHTPVRRKYEKWNSCLVSLGEATCSTFCHSRSCGTRTQKKMHYKACGKAICFDLSPPFVQALCSF
jgi:hypothetical protein